MRGKKQFFGLSSTYLHLGPVIHATNEYLLHRGKRDYCISAKETGHINLTCGCHCGMV